MPDSPSSTFCTPISFALQLCSANQACPESCLEVVPFTRLLNISWANRPLSPLPLAADQDGPAGIRPLLSDTGGGGGSNWPPGILADPPTHPHQKIFPQEKNEIYQRGPNLEVDFRYTNFFLASDPPPPRYSINQPLSKGLAGMPCSDKAVLCVARADISIRPQKPKPPEQPLDRALVRAAPVPICRCTLTLDYPTLHASEPADNSSVEGLLENGRQTGTSE